MGKLQKISTEKSAGLFEAMSNKHVPVNSRNPEMKQPKVEAEKDRSWASSEAAPKLSHNSIDEIDLVRNGHSIRSARCAPDGIVNTGGSNRFVGSSKDSSMSSYNLDQIAQNLSSKEATAEEKKSVAALRSLKQNEYKDAQSPKIGDDFSATKGNSVSKSSGSVSSRYMPGAGKMSIFDNADFERVQDLPGEKMEVRKASKDNSWQEIKKSSSIKDVNNRLFDNLNAQKESSSYKSLHQSTVDRLYQSMINKKDNQ